MPDEAIRDTDEAWVDTVLNVDEDRYELSRRPVDRHCLLPPEPGERSSSTTPRSNRSSRARASAVSWWPRPSTMPGPTTIVVPTWSFVAHHVSQLPEYADPLAGRAAATRQARSAPCRNPVAH